MNKKDFEKYIKEQFKDVPLENLEKNITKISNVWLPQILESMLKNHIKCKSCNKYVEKKDFEIQQDLEIHTEKTSSNKINEIEYLVTYKICPFCKNKEVNSKTFIRIVETYSSKKKKESIPGDIFRILRIANDLSITDSAKLADLTQVYIGEIERNKKNPSQKTKDKLLKTYNINTEQFLELLKYYKTIESKSELQKYQLMLIKTLEFLIINKTSEA